jgi:hypothetical protein
MQVKYRPQLYSFVHHKDVGEVVFTLRTAYQLNNSRGGPVLGGYYPEICAFASEIVRERISHSTRIQSDISRKQQAHRLELKDARDYAKNVNRKTKTKACRAIVIHNGFKIPLTWSGSQTKKASPEIISPSDDERSESEPEDRPVKEEPSIKLEAEVQRDEFKARAGEATDAMIVDETDEVRLRNLRAPMRSYPCPLGASDSVADEQHDCIAWRVCTKHRGVHRRFQGHR